MLITHYVMDVFTKNALVCAPAIIRLVTCEQQAIGPGGDVHISISCYSMV